MAAALPGSSHGVEGERKEERPGEASARPTGGQGLWLSVWKDPLASTPCTTGCTGFGAAAADGESLLLLATPTRLLRVFNGMDLQASIPLLDIPCSMSTVVQERGAASIAVATGAYVFVYRNLRPYMKFTLPSQPVDVAERAVWSEAKAFISDGAPVDALLSLGRKLKDLLSRGVQLTAQGKLAALGVDDGAVIKILEEGAHLRPIRTSVVTCTTTVFSERSGPREQQQLLLGTEAGQVHLLLASMAGVEKSLQVPGVPTHMAAAGCVQTDWRVAIATRDGAVHLAKNGVLAPHSVKTGVALVGVGWLAQGATGGRGPRLVAVDASGCVLCLSAQLKRLWSVRIPGEEATCMCTVSDKPGAPPVGVLVGTRSGHMVTVVEGRCLARDAVTAVPGDAVTTIACGEFAREPNTVVATCESGALHAFVLRRAAKLSQTGPSSVAVPEQDASLAVPRKTRLFVDMAKREREVGVDMHHVFQRELLRMRLASARTFVRVTSFGQGPTSVLGAGHRAQRVRLAVQVQGMGPRFVLRVQVHVAGKRDLAAAHICAAPTQPGALQCSPAVLALPVVVRGTSVDVTLHALAMENALHEAADRQLRLVLVHGDALPDAGRPSQPTSPVASTPLASAVVTLPALAEVGHRMG